MDASCPLCSRPLRQASLQAHLVAIHAGQRGEESWLCDCGFRASSFDAIADHCRQLRHNGATIRLDTAFVPVLANLLAEIQNKDGDTEQDSKLQSDSLISEYGEIPESISQPQETQPEGTELQPFRQLQGFWGNDTALMEDEEARYSRGSEVMFGRGPEVQTGQAESSISNDSLRSTPESTRTFSESERSASPNESPDGSQLASEDPGIGKSLLPVANPSPVRSKPVKGRSREYKSAAQTRRLEELFTATRYPPKEQKEIVAKDLGMTYKFVSRWLENRRRNGPRATEIGRKRRTRFTADVLRGLRWHYTTRSDLTKERTQTIAQDLGLESRQVMHWFYNHRRFRTKTK